MNYYIQEINFDFGEHFSKTAWSKARLDIDTILGMMGMKPIIIMTHESERQKASGFEKIWWHEKIRKSWEEQLKNLKQGDRLYIQIPVLDHSVLISHELKKIRSTGVDIILIAHDLESIRLSLVKQKSFAKNMRLKMEEMSIVNQATYIILHNKKMIEYSEKIGISENKAIELTLFDYLHNAVVAKDNGTFKRSVIIAGNLDKEKAGYVYNLPEGVRFNLYGINYTGEQNKYINYKGSFSPDELPGILDGGFGLVWDGTSIDLCNGVFGEYLRINNPHKTSLYLSAGIPVIIWEEAALADFIRENKVGLCIKSIRELKDILPAISLQEYTEMKQNAISLSLKLREGYFLKSAISKTFG